MSDKKLYSPKDVKEICVVYSCRELEKDSYSVEGYTGKFFVERWSKNQYACYYSDWESAVRDLKTSVHKKEECELRRDFEAGQADEIELLDGRGQSTQIDAENPEELERLETFWEEEASSEGEEWFENAVDGDESVGAEELGSDSEILVPDAIKIEVCFNDESNRLIDGADAVSVFLENEVDLSS